MFKITLTYRALTLKKHFILSLFCILFGLISSACLPVQMQLDSQATEIVESIFATLTASASHTPIPAEIATGPFSMTTPTASQKKPISS